MERMDQDMPFLLQYEHVAWFEDGRVRHPGPPGLSHRSPVRGVHRLP